MKFEIDSQTIEDLNLLGKYKPNSIFSIFNKTITRRGELLLERRFLNPYTNADKINQESSLLKLFQEQKFEFPFTHQEMSLVEQYIEGVDHKNIIASLSLSLKRKVLYLVAKDKELTLLQQGFDATIHFLRELKEYFTTLAANEAVKENGYYSRVEESLALLNDSKLEWIYKVENHKELSFLKFSLNDHQLRYTLSEPLHQLLDIVYEMDLLVSVSSVGRAANLTYAEATVADQSFVELKNVKHTIIENAVGNDLAIGHGSNLFFLTGANMAGKSTLMKSFGVALYLAHMGFPVAADSMRFSVLQGLYTSINVPDDLSMGYSHFYAEVVRVKKIAIAAASGKKFAIIFDELFKGTNVKDAYDATVTITDSFSKIEECIFIVSTHIMEAGLTLQESNENMQFQYLPTILEGNVPKYTYTLTDGISDERHGMRIVNNERIIEIIKEKK